MSTFKKVLVAVDLEEQSANYVLESARQLIPDVPLTVVHVMERSQYYNMGDASFAMVDDLHQKLVQEIEAFLQKLCDKHKIKEHHLLEGHPATMIQQHAEDNDHDLIVLGTHGRHGIRRLLGSTANSVLHGTERNVLAIRVPGKDVEVRPAKDKYQRILAAVDLSEESHQVLDIAQILGEQEHAELHVIHVVKPFHHAYAGISPATVSDVGVRFEQEADEQARAQMKTIAASRGIPAANMIVSHGAPQVEIHDQATELGADMVVVGTHGKHGVQLLLGSVANAVIHGITCDVLAVRIR
ncbi:MAG: universal stress protein [Gammaproteobacteria bacterium]|nr:universal stress protein [Gammaproteobacteria bacterium]